MVKTILIISIFSISGICQAQGISMKHFCDIQDGSASKRIGEIIRQFNLPYLTAEQLSGSIKCKSGELFIIRTSCVGLYKVAIISLKNPNSKKQFTNATRLFHMYKKNGSNETMTLCQPIAEKQ